MAIQALPLHALRSHALRSHALRSERPAESHWRQVAEVPPGPDEPAEERLARLAAAVGPLRRVLAAIAARLVATRAYERLCYARLGDYAREQPGISARQLQELARVHAALERLPALEHALVANALPWSKVRAVARVATAEDEHAWVARARALSIPRLEAEIRESAGSPRAAEAQETAPPRQVAVRCTPAIREAWSAVREVAQRVAGERLRNADVLEAVIAEGFSAVSIDPAFADDRPEPRSRRRHETEALWREEPPAARRARPRPLPHAVASLATGLDEADACELDRRLRRAVRLEQTLDATIAPLLRVVRSPDHEWSDAYRTLSRYAPDALGMSARKARALLRLERACDACPELREAFRSGRVSWVKAQTLLPLLLLDLDGEWRPAWVRWAERVTVRRLAEDVERALLLRAGHHLAWHRCKFHPERAQDPIPPGERQLCAPDVDPEATQRLAWHVPHEVAVLFTAVRETLRARMEADRPRGVTEGEVFEWLLDHALRTWNRRAPGTRRPDPVIERDGYRCAVPGCTSRRNLHDHHITFRSAQGSDAPDNRVTLCAFHHLRCLHAGIMRVRGAAPDGLLFELPLARYRSGDLLVPGAGGGAPHTSG